MEFLQTIFQGLLYILGIVGAITLIFAIITAPINERKKRKHQREELKKATFALGKTLEELSKTLEEAFVEAVEETIEEEVPKKQTKKKTTKKTTKTKEK
jgi:hypothetical protein